jgi:hypothetical protein
VGKFAETGSGRGGLVDLAGKYLVTWISSAAIETFLAVLELAQERPPLHNVLLRVLLRVWPSPRSRISRWSW